MTRPVAAGTTSRSKRKAVSTNGKTSDKASALEVRFRAFEESLGASRRALIRRILEEPQETYFLSSRELGKRYGVDSATIVRSIQAIGYERFADFAGDLRKHFVTQITPYTALRAAAEKNQRVSYYVENSVAKDLENLTLLKDTIDPDKIVGLARQIHRASRVVVVGLDFAASLALSMAYGLVRLGCDAEAPIGTEGVLKNKIKVLSKKDLVVPISFGKCLRNTVESTKLARRLGIPTFGITDGDDTPIAKFCDDYLLASIERASFLDSYVAPVAAINAILVACAHTKTKRALELFAESEKEYTRGVRWYQDPE